jgi:hypothetical protein
MRQCTFVRLRQVARVVVGILLCWGVTLGASAESDAPYGGATETKAYSFVQPTQIFACDAAGKRSGPASGVFAPGGAAYYVLKEHDGDVVLKFLSWPQSSANYDKFNVDASASPASPRIWCVPRSEVSDRSRPYKFRDWYPEMNFGVLVVPIKLRTGIGRQDASFTTDVTLAGALDLTWRVSHYRDISLHIPLFAGVGAAQVVAAGQTEEKATPTISFGTGIGISAANAGAGLVIGWDMINDNSTIDWDHQLRAWFGVSIGATFGVTASDDASVASQ